MKQPTRFQHLPRSRRQRGVASLVVVMILFFIISLVAAYTNRNLIFEQRTSVNQYRATQALEAADAGLEWALAMLNQGRIDATCNNSSSVSDSSFRGRYIITNPTTGALTPANTGLRPSCVYNGSGWTCSCPTSGDPVLTAPTGAGIFPAFRVRFQQVDPIQPGVIRVVVAACTRLDNDCLADSSAGAPNEGRATVSALTAITANLASPPTAALTARGNVSFSGGTFTAFSTNPDGGGITVQAGGDVTSAGSMDLHGPTGTPGDLTKVPLDPALQNLTASGSLTAEDRMFAAPFNMWRSSFRTQPAAVTLSCGVSGCSAAELRDKIQLNPGRPIWITGGLNIDSAGDIGSATAPVLLVINGNLNFTATGVTLFGLVYVSATDWTSAGSGQIQGAVIAEGNVGGTSTLTVVHDVALLNQLRYSVGSMVRVPGSWKDFQ
jgi:Tfp pilus assembly protein PilX